MRGYCNSPFICSSIHSTCIFLILKNLHILERREGREKEKERNIDVGEKH